MPGRSPYNAYSAFVTPLASALSCVARAKIVCTRGGNSQLGKVHLLLLGGVDEGAYVKLKGDVDLELRARMRYEIIEDDREGMGPYRVTTRWYEYSLQESGGQAVVEYHWHPGGLSHEDRPHVHLGTAQLRPNAVMTKKQHLLTGRVTFEQVIRQAIEYGVEPLCADWDDRLTAAETPHVLYRTWSVAPNMR
ncbi:hypothetical protein GCM10027605_05750 [Micromonospora zhanjiangensis]